MHSVLCHIPNVFDATAFYRSTHVFDQLRKTGSVEFKHTREFNRAHISSNDILFMQRPSLSDDIKIMSIAKDVNVPVWVDYDDDLFSVPGHNPASRFYVKDVLDNMAKIIVNADAISVSTDTLKNRFVSLLSQFTDKEALEKKIWVIPNAFPDHLNMPKIGDQLPERTKRVVWRGSHTHEMDLCSVGGALDLASRQFPDWEFVFMGDPAWSVVDNIDPSRRQVIKTQDTLEYFKTLYSLAPSIMIVPLLDNEFNRSKSNIAWIEGTWAGAACLVPNFPEWTDKGAFEQTHFVTDLIHMLDGSMDLNAVVKSSQVYIREHLMLSQVNRKRRGLLDSLLASRNV